MGKLSPSLTHIRVYRILLRKFVSLLTTIVLLANSYLPYFAYGLQPTIAHADAPPALSFSFDTAKNDFVFSVNSSVEVQYSLVYVRESDGTTQQEGVMGSGTDASGTFSRSMYAGTCSLLSCVKHIVRHGIFKVSVPTANWIYEKVFEINADGDLVVKKEGVAKEFEMSDAESEWVNNPSDDSLGKIELSTPAAEVSLEKECLSTDQTTTDSTWADWQTDTTTETSQTNAPVNLGVRYTFPIEENVSVMFTCLPKDESLRKPLKIQRVKVSDLKLPEGTNSTGEYAYDITTDMADGTFEYEVSLPKVADQTAEVMYIEKTVEEVKAQPVAVADVKEVVAENVEQAGDQVVAKEMDHFTIFIATYSDNTFTVEKSSYAQGETVHARSTSLTNNNSTWYRIDLIEPDGTTLHNIGSCARNISSKSGSYILPSSAPLGIWTASIEKHDSSSECTNRTDIKETGTDTFTVTQGNYPDLVVTKTNNVNGAAVVDQAFVWTLTVTNNGTANATFSDENILEDDLPNSDVTYSPTSNLPVTTSGGVTGSIDCDISSSTLSCDDNNGGSAVVIPPGGSFSVDVTVTPTDAGTLTNPRSGSSNVCEVDPDEEESETNETNNTCSDSVTVSLYETVVNPSLPQACGLDIAIVIDNSTSIDSGELTQIKNAMTAFTSALSGTPTYFSVTRFATTASVVQGFTSDISAVNSAITGIPVGGGYTNWQDGLTKGQSTFDPRINPNLVIFASDGNPNRTGSAGTEVTESVAVANAVTVSNTIKTGGTRMLAIGVGSDLDTANMIAISGPNVNTGNVLTSDVITTDFAGLAGQLATFASQTCGGTITVNKYIGSVAPGNLATDSWSFTTNVTGYESVSTTNGSVNFPVPVGSDYSVTESSVLPGYTFGSAACQKPNGNGGFTPVGTPGGMGVSGITMGSNDIISCDFVNIDVPEPGTITIVKDVVPNDGSVWDFTILPPGNIALAYMDMPDGGSHTFTNLVPGSYTITESTSSDYTTSVVCDNGQNALSHSIGFTLSAGEDVTCTFTNARNSGQVTFVKTVDQGPAQPSDWYFSVFDSNNGLVGDTFTSGNTYPINLGNYTVEESTEEGYSFDSASGICTFNADTGDIEMVVSANGGTCTIANTRDVGSIRAHKRIDINGDGDWDDTDEASDTYANANGFSWALDGAGHAYDALVSNIPTTLSNYSHSVDEYMPAGYHFVGWYAANDTQRTCANPNSPTLPFTVSILKDQTTEIILCNARDTGNLKAQKIVDDGTDLTLWSFSLNGGAPVQADAQGFVDFGQVPTGFLSVTESGPTGYSLSSIGGDCTENPNVSGQADVNVNKDQTKTCIFTNVVDKGTIHIVKDVIPDDSVTQFDYTLTGPHNYSVSDKVWETNPSGHANIPVGSYTLTEVNLPGYDESIVCSNNATSTNNTVTFTLEKDEVVTCTITNRKRGSITIVKDSVNNNGQDFSFGTTGGIGGFILDDDGNNANTRSNTKVFSNVTPGTYTITEGLVNGWRLTNLVCVGDDNYSTNGRTATVRLDPGESVTCTYTNTQLGSISGFKYNDKNGNNVWDDWLAGENRMNGWQIYIQGVASDVTSGWFIVPFGLYELENLLPGTYQVCETMQPGWYSSLPGGSNCQEVTINPGQDKTGVNFGNHEELKIKAYKVVCDNESDLPNWGNSAPHITANTAQHYVNTHPNCRLESGWDFQYGFNGQVVKYGNGDQTGLAPAPWHLLGTTSGSNPAQVSLSQMEGNGIWVRENLKSDYVPFSYPPAGPTENDYSAEMYCHTDGEHYDNFDRISSPQFGETYYCVAFNALNKGTIIVEKQTIPDGNEDSFSFSGAVEGVIADGGQLTEDVSPGTHEVVEDVSSSTFDLIDITCDDTNSTGNVETGTASFDVSPGETVKCTFTNRLKGDVVVYKFNDLDGDGYHDENEPYLPEWNILMNEVEGAEYSQSTDELGSTTFSLKPGEYILGEDIQEGWYQSNIYCEGDEQEMTPTPTGQQGPTDTPTPTPTPQGICHWNEGADKWNALAVNIDNPGHTGHELDFVYDGPRDVNGHPANDLQNPTPETDGDAWCESNDPNDRLTFFDRILGVTTVLAQEIDNFINGYPVTVEPGGRKVCYIGNYQKSTITINKDVLDHLGQDISDNQSFDVDAGDELGTQAFSEENPYIFTVNTGTYTFEEVNIDSKYLLSDVIGDEDSETPGVQVTVQGGESKSVTFVNQKVAPALRISKFNNKWPVPQNTGVEVLYTILIKVLGNDLQDVKVIDLPPAGFVYKNGSWTALKNGVPYSIPQPAYASPGTWLLGDLAKDDVITLTYIATISGDTEPGIYKDLAWAYGCSESDVCTIESEDSLLASSEDSTKTDPGIITDTVVGTKVELAKVGTPPNTINILEKREVGSVLGASTQRLPATGLNNALTVFALFQLILGAVFGLFYFLNKRMRKVLKVGLSIMLVGSLILFAQHHVYAIEGSAITVRVEQPKSPTNEGFDLGFVVLDKFGRPLTAKCYVSSPENSWTFTQFGADIALQAGGNSGICPVLTGDLAEGDNVYEVRVTVSGEPASPYVVQDENITVKYIPNSSRPGVPRNYNREDISSCEKKITFLTADDAGKTVRVEVYRGENTEFTLNDGTKVATFNIGSNTAGTHIEIVPDCNKKYYYALRAFDAAGNYSDPVGDRVYETVTTSTTTSTTETTGQAGTTDSGAVIVRESNLSGEILGEETIELSGTPEATDEGEILGDETTPTQGSGFVNAVKETVTSRGAWVIVGGILLLFGILYFVYRKWTGKEIK